MNRKQGWGLGIGLAVLVGLLAWPQPPRGSAPILDCRSHLKQLHEAAGLYAVDHDNRLMAANRWMDTAEPYAKTHEAFHCALLAREKKPYGYAMNRFLGGAVLAGMDESEKVHLFYDSETVARNANEYLPHFPIPGRHKGGRNVVVFANGHTEMIPIREP